MNEPSRPNAFSYNLVFTTISSIGTLLLDFTALIYYYKFRSLFSCLLRHFCGSFLWVFNLLATFGLLIFAKLFFVRSHAMGTLRKARATS